MRLSNIQQSIVDLLNKTSFTATNSIANKLNLHKSTIRNNAREMIAGGILEEQKRPHKLAPVSIKLKENKTPNFDRLLFSQ